MFWLRWLPRSLASQQHRVSTHSVRCFLFPTSPIMLASPLSPHHLESGLNAPVSDEGVTRYIGLPSIRGVLVSGDAKHVGPQVIAEILGQPASHRAYQHIP